MMRMNRILSTLLIFLLFPLTFICFSCTEQDGNNRYEQDDLPSFSLTDYKDDIDMFQEKKLPKENLGMIEGKEKAIEIAERKLIEVYGKEQIESQKPLKVFFDANNQAWLVTGSLPNHSVGGVGHIVFLVNGDLLAVWHDR